MPAKGLHHCDAAGSPAAFFIAAGRSASQRPSEALA
jgi:hypothetical protein